MRELAGEWDISGVLEPLHRRAFILFVSLLLGSSLGCALLQGGQRPVIPDAPTPLPTAPPLSEEELQEIVFDPRSDVVPGIDPTISELMGAVSQQNLFAYVQTLEGFGTRNTYSATDRPQWGIGAARLWIFNEFVRVGNGRLQVEFHDFLLNEGQPTDNQQNVVATLPGTSTYPGAIVLSAHYDSRTIDPGDGTSLAPGANDNGSGVAALLEVARLLSSRSWRQDIIFIAFAAEEQGRYGSQAYVTEHMLEGAVFDAVINADIVGGRPGIPQSIRVFADGPDNSPAHQLSRYMDYVGGLYLPTFFIDVQNAVDREGRWSDHVSFLNAGVAAVRITESEEDFERQHNSLDTFDQIDYSYLMQVAQLNLVTAANAAGAPPPPPIPNIVRMADPGTFLVTWPVDPDAASYALSFRPLGSPDYPPFRFVSREQAGNVALTGFDPQMEYAFSMAAVDENGRIGLFSPELLIPAAP